MMFYDYYADVPEDTLRAFVTGQQLGRLVTVMLPGSRTSVSIPSCSSATASRCTCIARMSRLADLVENSQCAFEVDEVHGHDPVALGARHKCDVRDRLSPHGDIRMRGDGLG